MPTYKFLAECENRACHVTHFERHGVKTNYTDKDGDLMPIERIMCPNCYEMGLVLRIDQVGQVQEVA